MDNTCSCVQQKDQRIDTVDVSSINNFHVRTKLAQKLILYSP